MDANRSIRSWHDLDLTIQDGVVFIQTTGNDPYLWLSLPSRPELQTDWMLDLEYFCPDGINSVQAHLGLQARAAGMVDLESFAKAEGWMPYAINLDQLRRENTKGTDTSAIRIDLGRRANRHIKIRRLQTRPMSDRELAIRRKSEGKKKAQQALAASIRGYHQRSWPARIDRISAEPDAIRVEGSFAVDMTDAPVYLIRRNVHSITALAASENELANRWIVQKGNDGQSFTCRIPNATAGSAAQWGDRFQLVRQDAPPQSFTPLSAAHWFSPDLSVASAPTGQEHHQVRKGLTCLTTRFPMTMLDELGLQHGSININMNSLVRQVGNGNDAIYQLDEAGFRRLDATVSYLSKARIQLAGILLIPNSPTAPLVHPDADPAATYAMPNLVDQAHAQAYRAVVIELARRYGSNSDAGTIDHWIIHNEVDYGWQWTNMGPQPMDIFMDHYVRSMRMVDSVVRHFNTNARVFISLTHRWNAQDCQENKTYAPKAMLQWLQKHGQTEGDFPWGVAYHPYPQSLWESDTWNDDLPTESFDTPLITIKNLSVLDRFLNQPEWLDSSGRVRPVICSEQGFHAPETDDASLQRQSAALVYTWKQLSDLGSIIAFDYHRPIDHPNEGGLRLGLRGLVSKRHPLGPAKPAWSTYQALGTEAEMQLRQTFQQHWQPSGRNH
ncbi:DUF5722 domain-containing protein [Crateriforma conspicua]|uniref:DUF5722 domain-containing protein n=1 Tax=Crateriforma conspicua TaxID=2527996 RepID=A0A5C6FVE0_9PLAN|nr:DUF5722 domain-containing protein [Crateriforma conspicua]TWU65430.1 hypothetical protein V7x_09770 [Crateriforma conspicua]